LKEFALDDFVWYWYIADQVEKEETAAEVIDEVLDKLIEMKYIKYASEKKAKPKVRNPNNANAEYIQIKMELTGVMLEDVNPKAKDFLFCNFCGEIADKIIISKGHYDTYKLTNNGKYELITNELPSGELEINCVNCGNEFTLFPEQMEKFGLI
jgi:hypothetical protein